MKQFLLSLAVILAHFSFTFGQGFKNPVLPGFHADPAYAGQVKTFIW